MSREAVIFQITCGFIMNMHHEYKLPSAEDDNNSE